MKTVVITGGSRGIGAGAVEAFAARGDRVYFLYCNRQDAANALAEKTGATAICCDVSDKAAVDAAFAQIPQVDVLVCNAGLGHYGLLQDLDEAAWDKLFDVNVKGMYTCIQAALPSLLKTKGVIITVSSMWGIVGASCEAAYSATKGAVIALTKSLAKELGPMGVRCNSVAPGVILTDMCQGLTEQDLKDLADQSLVGRNGTPEDVAHAICYLADADFVTGEVLSVNGGFIV